jgi:hypothetical protein
MRHEIGTVETRFYLVLYIIIPEHFVPFFKILRFK